MVRPLHTPASGPRRFIHGAVIMLASLGVLAGSIAIFALVQGDSAIARRRGEVTSVKGLSDGVSAVCIKNTTDAGGNYGNRKNLPSVCWHGLLEGVSPAVGACVILQIEGETSYLRVETAEGC